MEVFGVKMKILTAEIAIFACGINKLTLLPGFSLYN
jgi:hypothetical protein